MTTFSQMVDTLAKEIVRPNMVTMLPDYLNQTIREVHTNAQTSEPVRFADNRVEAVITIDNDGLGDDSYVWPLPDMTRFQLIEAVYYHSIERYVTQKSPAVARVPNFRDPMRGYYWYRTGPTLAFSRPGGVGDTIDISMFFYPRRLVYQPIALRKVDWDDENEVFTYKNGGSILDLPKATNWIIERHRDCLMEGVRAKAYKRMDDENRARLAYSQFEALRAAMIHSEEYQPEAVYVK